MRRILLATAIILTGCGPAVFSPSDALAVTVSINAQTFRIGESVSISTIVRNQGREPTDIDVNPCPPAFEVLNAAGTLVGPDSPICIAALVKQTLQPGSSYVFTQTWGGTGYRVSPSGPTPQLPAGTYQVRGRAFNSHTTSAAVTVRIDP